MPLYLHRPIIFHCNQDQLLWDQYRFYKTNHHLNLVKGNFELTKFPCEQWTRHHRCESLRANNNLVVLGHIFISTYHHNLFQDNTGLAVQVEQRSQGVVQGRQEKHIDLHHYHSDMMYKGQMWNTPDHEVHDCQLHQSTNYLQNK